MSSSYDEFISNFDLTHLSSEEPVQPPELNIEKQRKSTLLVKTKIISTDYLIQDYLNKTESYNQVVKAHNTTKENLKEACINFKNMSERCTFLEKEQKLLIAKQEMFEKKAIEAENKYSGLISYTNQLQMLVKELETAKDALIVEKQLEKDDNKVAALQKEKESMLKDIMIMKDIILGKKKRSKRHTKLLKQYEKESNISMFVESVDDMDSDDDSLANSKIETKTIHKTADMNPTSNFEHNYIDNSLDSDFSTGEVSVDTGRGSSRANSDDKCLNSPDYFMPVSSQKISHRDVIKQVDVANSPITIIDSVSVATSPIMFNQPLFEDLFDNKLGYKKHHIEGYDYIMDDTIMSDLSDSMKDRNNLVDACTSPIPIEQKVFDVGTSPKQNNECNYKKYHTEGHDHIIDNIVVNDKIDSTLDRNKLVDACTSPIPIEENIVDIGTTPIENDKDNYSKTLCNTSIRKSLFIDLEKMNKSEDKSFHDSDILTQNRDLIDVCTSPIQISDTDKFIGKQTTFCEKSTCTEMIPVVEKNIVVDACTSPLESRLLISTGTSPIINCKRKGEQDKSVVAKCLFREERNQESSVIEELIPDGEICKSKTNVINATQETLNLGTKEKICLESHSSSQLQYENCNDVEVQDILKKMKLHYDLISPIPRTPSKSRNTERFLTIINNSLINVQKSLKELDHKFHSLEGQVGDMKDQCNMVKENVSEIQNIIKGDLLKDYADDTSISEEQRNPQQQPMINMEINEVSTSQDTIDTPISLNLDKGIVVEDNSEEINLTIEKPNVLQVSDIAECETSMNNQQSIATDNTDADKSRNRTRITDSQSHSYTDLHEPNEMFEEDSIDVTQKNNSLNSYSSNSTTEISIPNIPVIENITAKKIKKLSKLEKFRIKLKPTSKIKKVITPVTNHSSKPCKIVSKDITSKLNNKIAYDKAVKVMAEERLNQALHDNVKVSENEETDKIIRRLNKLETSPIRDLFDCTPISNRTRTRTLSRKEEDISVIASPQKALGSVDISKDVEKSPMKRKVHKRTADTNLDSFQSSCKRILRSSNIYPADNKTSLPNPPLNSTSNVIECLPDHPDGIASRKESDKEDNLMETDNDVVLVDDSNSKDHQCHKDPVVIHIDPGNFVTSDHCYISSICETEDAVITADVSKTSDEVCGNSEVIQSNLIDDQNVENITTELKNTQENVEPIINLKDNHSVEENFLNATHTKQDERLSLCESDNTGTSSKGLCSNKENVKADAMSLKQKLRVTGCTKNPVVELMPLENMMIGNCKSSIISYSDLDLYTSQLDVKCNQQNSPDQDTNYLKDNILCSALEKYGVITVKHFGKKVPENITENICQKIEDAITAIIASHTDEQKSKMNDLISSLQNFKKKYILAGLMKYLKDPTRKLELKNKVNSGPAPPMTKAEVILLYVIEHLNGLLPARNFINRLWNNIEHALFQLNHTPHFDQIESMSHFYAVMCRYFRNKSRLRCFMLDAMYCLQFKAIPLITQCLEVCPRVLPFAHEHMAKTSLVICLVYLLHFYKCQDKLNRAQDIRNTLTRKYSYRFSEWNEMIILEIFRKAIINLRGIHNDKKMLRLALIILCKRHGAKWCQTNVIQNMLLPIIEKPETPDRIKQFCILMLGPLLKPFPADRKAQCEIVINQLLQLLKQNPTQEIKEAIYSSLIFMSKHNEQRVVEALLSWNPPKVSSEFEEILNDYVMDKPLAVWKKLVSRKASAYS